MGALISIATPGLVLLGLVAFAAGLTVGVIGWRHGVRKNRAAIGIILNSANLLLNVGLLTAAAPR